MRRLNLAVFVAAAVAVGCGVPQPPQMPEESVVKVSGSLLTNFPCNGSAPVKNSFNVFFLLNGVTSCKHYIIPASDSVAVIHFEPTANQGLGVITRVDTGQESAVFVCNSANPAGVQDVSPADGLMDAPYAPCYTSGGNNGEFRVRGPAIPDSTGGYGTHNGIPYTAADYPYAWFYYGPTSKTVSFSVGAAYSFVATKGVLPGANTCPYVNTATTSDDPTHAVNCNSRSDSGLQDWRENNDPANNTNCCNISGQWIGTPVTFGAPCVDHNLVNGAYSTENYSCPAYP